ncbi:MAG: hypothetical protein FD129_2327, partial [bacterium]
MTSIFRTPIRTRPGSRSLLSL